MEKQKEKIVRFDPLSTLIKNSSERSAYEYGYVKGLRQGEEKTKKRMEMFKKSLEHRIEEISNKKVPKLEYQHSVRFTELAEILVQKWYLDAHLDIKKMLEKLTK